MQDGFMAKTEIYNGKMPSNNKERGTRHYHIFFLYCVNISSD